MLLKELPSYVPKAFVAIEDRRFYEHYGVDPFGICARAGCQRPASRRGPRRLHHHPATRQESVSNSRTYHHPQAAGGAARGLAGAQVLQDADSRIVPEPGLFRLRRLRHRAGLAALLRKIRAPHHHRRGRDAGRAGEVSFASCTVAQFRRRRAARKNRARHHGRTWIHHAIQREACARAPPRIVAQAANGSVNYAADWIMDVLNDVLGHVEDDIVVRTTIDAGMQARAERALTDELTAEGRQRRRRARRDCCDDAGRRGARHGGWAQLRR